MKFNIALLALFALLLPLVYATPTVDSISVISTYDRNTTFENISAIYSTSGDTVDVIDWRMNNVSLAVLQLPFEFGSNDTYTKDYSSYNRFVNVTYDGSPGPIWSDRNSGNCVEGGCYGFDNNSYAEVYLPEFESMTQYSIATWFKVSDETINIQELASKQNQVSFNNPPYQFFLRWVNSTREVSFVIGNANMNSWNCVLTTSTSGNWTTNTWYHIVAKWDNHYLYIYKDGVMLDNASCDYGGNPQFNGSIAPIRVGYSIAGQGIEKWIDEFKFFNYSISDDQIKEIYDAESSVNIWNNLKSSNLKEYQNFSACLTPLSDTEEGAMVCSNDLTIRHYVTPSITYSPPTVLGYPWINRSWFIVNVSLTGSDLIDNGTIYLFWSDNTFINATNGPIINWTMPDLPNNTVAYYYKANITDFFGASATTGTQYIMPDTIMPSVQYFSPTEISGSVLTTRTNIVVNVTANDTWLQYKLTRFYNSTGGMKYSNGNDFINWTGLSDGLYFFNTTAYDNAGNTNTTETRNVTILTTILSVFDLKPIPGSHYNISQVINVSANITDTTYAIDIARVITHDPGNYTWADDLVLLNGTDMYYDPYYIIPNRVGRYDLTFFVNDTFGNVNTSETTFFVGDDVTSPFWLGPEPYDEIITKEQGVNQTFVANDVINVVSITISDNVHFSIATTPYPEGTPYPTTGLTGYLTSNGILTAGTTYPITIIATDTSNNTLVKTIQITVRSEPNPALTLIMPLIVAFFGIGIIFMIMNGMLAISPTTIIFLLAMITVLSSFVYNALI